MPSYQVTQSSAGASQVIPLDLKRFSFGVGIIVTITGTLTCTIQITGDNVQKQGYTASSGNWNDHADLDGLTASANGSLEFTVTAIRVNVTSYTNGSVVLSIVQAEG